MSGPDYSYTFITESKETLGQYLNSEWGEDVREEIGERKGTEERRDHYESYHSEGE